MAGERCLSHSAHVLPKKGKVFQPLELLEVN